MESDKSRDAGTPDTDDEDNGLQPDDGGNVDDEFYEHDQPTKRITQPFIPETITSMAEVSRNFSTEFQQRFPEYRSHSTFFVGSLDEACLLAEDNKLLVIYLHHDESVSANIFCTELLCNDDIASFLNEETVLWAWDLSSFLNRSRFEEIVSEVFGPQKPDIFGLTQRNLPVLIPIVRCLGTHQPLSPIEHETPEKILGRLRDANRNFQTSMYGMHQQQIGTAAASLTAWERSHSRQNTNLESGENVESVQDTSASMTILPNVRLVEAKQRLILNCRRHRLQVHGLMPTDGNSFFHAVCDQLKLIDHHKTVTHVELRNSVVDFLRNPIIQGVDGMVDLRCAIEDMTWEQYCENMRRPNEWVDHVVVHATAHMLHRNMMILMSSPSADTCPVSTIEVPHSGSEPIRLGHIHEFQYQSLMRDSPEDVDGSLTSEEQDTCGIQSCGSNQQTNPCQEDASQMDQETNDQDWSTEDLKVQLPMKRKLDEEVNNISKRVTMKRPSGDAMQCPASLENTDPDPELSPKSSITPIVQFLQCISSFLFYCYLSGYIKLIPGSSLRKYMLVIRELNK